MQLIAFDRIHTHTRSHIAHTEYNIWYGYVMFDAGIRVVAINAIY